MKRSHLRRNARIKPRSKKREDVMKVRKEMLSQHMKNYCEAEKEGAPGKCYGVLTPHEPLTRARGGSLTDPSNLRTVCVLHNANISQDVATMRWATEAGFLRRA